MRIFSNVWGEELYWPFRSLAAGRAEKSLDFHHVRVQGAGLRVLLFHTQQRAELAVTHHLKPSKSQKELDHEVPRRS